MPNIQAIHIGNLSVQKDKVIKIIACPSNWVQNFGVDLPNMILIDKYETINGESDFCRIGIIIQAPGEPAKIFWQYGVAVLTSSPEKSITDTDDLVFALQWLEESAPYFSK